MAVSASTMEAAQRYFTPEMTQEERNAIINYFHGTDRNNTAGRWATNFIGVVNTGVPKEQALAPDPTHTMPGRLAGSTAYDAGAQGGGGSGGFSPHAGGAAAGAPVVVPRRSILPVSGGVIHGAPVMGKPKFSRNTLQSVGSPSTPSAGYENGVVQQNIYGPGGNQPMAPDSAPELDPNNPPEGWHVEKGEDGRIRWRSDIAGGPLYDPESQEGEDPNGGGWLKWPFVPSGPLDRNQMTQIGRAAGGGGGTAPQIPGKIFIGMNENTGLPAYTTDPSYINPNDPRIHGPAPVHVSMNATPGVADLNAARTGYTQAQTEAMLRKAGDLSDAQIAQIMAGIQRGDKELELRVAEYTRRMQEDERNFGNQEAWRSQNRADTLAQQDRSYGLQNRQLDQSDAASLRRMQEDERNFANAEAWRSRNFGEDTRRYDQGFGLSEAGLTGQYQGAPTMAYQNQQFNQGITAGGLTGSYNGAPTLAAELGRGNLDVSRGRLDLERGAQNFAQARDPYSFVQRLDMLSGGQPQEDYPLQGVPQAEGAWRLSRPPQLQERTGQMLGGHAPGVMAGAPVLQAKARGGAYDATPATALPPRSPGGVNQQSIPGTGVPAGRAWDTEMATRPPQGPAAGPPMARNPRLLGLGGPPQLAASPANRLAGAGGRIGAAFSGAPIASARSPLPLLSGQARSRLTGTELAAVGAMARASGISPEDYFGESERLSRTTAAPQIQRRTLGRRY